MSSTNRFNILKNTTTSVANKTTNASNTSDSVKNNFNTNRFVSKHVNEERNKKQKEAEFIKSLDNLTAFPILQKTTTITKTDLNNNNNNNNEKDESITFIEAMKTKKKQIRSEKITTDDDVPTGCVCIKYDEISKKPLWVYGKNTTSIANEKSPLEENEEPRVVFQRLVDLHQGRKYNHISKWGIDEYEKMFLYQNYDYDYFDNLDDQIQQDMEKYYQSNTYNLNNYNNDSENDNY
jgi:hypothetical protein